jgi:hypothetical protein
MNRRIVALDPGGTTGWATVTIMAHQEPVFNHGMLTSKNHHKKLFDLLLILHEGIDELTVVCESFEYRNASRAGLELVSTEYIGVMKLFCQENDITYHMQSASQGKIRDKPTAFVKPDNLKRLGLWSPNQIHAMDAYGHLLYYLINYAKTGFEKELLQKGWKN